MPCSVLLTCSDSAAALGHFPALEHRHWAAAAACRSNLQRNGVKTDLKKRLVQVLAESKMSTFHILRMGTYHTSEA